RKTCLVFIAIGHSSLSPVVALGTDCERVRDCTRTRTARYFLALQQTLVLQQAEPLQQSPAKAPTLSVSISPTPRKL
ncbi:MAG TPA: hypothetical protein VEQ63_12880, partial [Bryobacteraceae bacterium]|nr:hypothetical protein [Bryobacteraceae bacterium]